MSGGMARAGPGNANVGARNVALALTFVIVLAAWLVLQVHWPMPPLQNIYTAEHVTYFAMYDAFGQRLAHKILLVLVVVAAIALSSATGRRWHERFLRQPANRRLITHLRNVGSAYVAALFFIVVASAPSRRFVDATTIAPFDWIGARIDRLAARAIGIARWEAVAHPYAFAALILIGALAIAFVVFWFWRRPPRLLSALPRFALADARRWMLMGAAVVAFLVTAPAITLTMTTELAALLLVCAAVTRLRVANRETLVWVMLAGYLVFLFLPGFVEPLAPTLPTLDAPNGLPIEYIENHYAFTLGPGDRLALGRQLYDGVTPYYGVLLPVILGWVEKARGLLSFEAHVRLVQALNLLFVLLAFAGYRMWTARHALLAFAPLLLVAPWLHGNHLAVLHPNQSGWRFMGLPIAMLALLSLRRRGSNVSAVFLACTAALLWLVNIETGIALAAGYGVYLACRFARSVADLGSIASLFALASLTTLSLLVIGMDFVQGEPLELAARAFFAGQLEMLRRFGGGYGGLAMRLDPLMLLVFAHSTYIVLKSFAGKKARPMSFASSFRTAVAATVLVWGAYYANRPDAWNAWTYLYLYGFLLAHYFDPRLWRCMFARLRRGFVPMRAALFVLVLLPFVVSINVAALARVAHAMKAVEPAAKDATIAVSGVLFPVGTANELLEKARYLRGFEHRGATYLTVNGYLMPLLTSMDNNLPIMDIFGETVTNSDFDRLVESIFDLAPENLLVDDPDSSLSGGEAQRKFFARLRERLTPKYHRVSATSGWELWRR